MLPSRHSFTLDRSSKENESQVLVDGATHSILGIILFMWRKDRDRQKQYILINVKQSKAKRLVNALSCEKLTSLSLSLLPSSQSCLFVGKTKCVYIEHIHASYGWRLKRVFSTTNTGNSFSLSSPELNPIDSSELHGWSLLCIFFLLSVSPSFQF